MTLLQRCPRTAVISVFFCVGGEGGRPGVGAAHHHLGSRASGRLQQAFHESRYQHHVQEAREGRAGRRVLHEAAVLRDLDVRHLRVHRRQRRPVTFKRHVTLTLTFNVSAR